MDNLINRTSKYKLYMKEILAISYLPMTATLMLLALFRCVEKSKYSMYVSVLAVFANVFFNGLMIFGKFGCVCLGIIGAAWEHLFPGPWKQQF